jgi:hypothetical protein
MGALGFLWRDASRRNRLLRTSGLASLSLPSWGSRSSSSGVVLCMTDLTWMRGLVNISVEGGPERSQVLNGP